MIWLTCSTKRPRGGCRAVRGAGGRYGPRGGRAPRTPTGGPWERAPCRPTGGPWARRKRARAPRTPRGDGVHGALGGQHRRQGSAGAERRRRGVAPLVRRVRWWCGPRAPAPARPARLIAPSTRDVRPGRRAVRCGGSRFASWWICHIRRNRFDRMRSAPGVPGTDRWCVATGRLSPADRSPGRGEVPRHAPRASPRGTRLSLRCLRPAAVGRPVNRYGRPRVEWGRSWLARTRGPTTGRARRSRAVRVTARHAGR